MQALYCDWCNEPIEGELYGHVKVVVHGLHNDRRWINRELHLHSGNSYETDSCYAKAMALVDFDRDFDRPDAGYEWKLVPVVERSVPFDKRKDMTPVLGVTPLEDLGLKRPIFEALVYAGYSTVEHLVDARRRGRFFVRGLGAKRLAELDRILIERGYLGSEAVA